jgi:hypothetical protein
VQLVLIERGFELEADGVLGPRTRRVLVEFQRREGLQVTGRIDSRTVTELGVSISSSGSSTIGQGRGSGQPSGKDAGNQGGNDGTPPATTGQGQGSGAKSNVPANQPGAGAGQSDQGAANQKSDTGPSNTTGQGQNRGAAKPKENPQANRPPPGGTGNSGR